MVRKRRRFLASLAAAGGALAGCGEAAQPAHARAAAATWRHGDRNPRDLPALRRELVRYATLAPSSHNTQCWRFALGPDAISILPDRSRRCAVVDPDDHHLFVSLGCAAENLILAAQAHGWHAQPRFDPAGEGAIRVGLERASPRPTESFEAIPLRQCSRSEYDGRPVGASALRRLEQAGAGDGVGVLLLTDAPARERVLEYVTAGNSAQMADPAFVAELRAWIRFGEAEAVRAADGLYAGSSGSPVLPRWLGELLFGLFFTAQAENDRYARQIRSSPVIAVFHSDTSERARWVEVGRCYQRFALLATALGLRNAFINQPVEVTSLRPQFAAAFGLGGRRPDLVVRFGYGPEMPRSLRRPPEAVIV
jgi:hypothetical protein